MHSTRMTDVGKWKWMRIDIREEPSKDRWWHCAMKQGIINLSLFLQAIVNKQTNKQLQICLFDTSSFLQSRPISLHIPLPPPPPHPQWSLLWSWKRPHSSMTAWRELMTSLPPLNPVGELPIILSFSMLPSGWCKSLTDYLYLGFTTLSPTYVDVHDKMPIFNNIFHNSKSFRNNLNVHPWGTD